MATFSGMGSISPRVTRRSRKLDRFCAAITRGANCTIEKVSSLLTVALRNLKARLDRCRRGPWSERLGSLQPLREIMRQESGRNLKTAADRPVRKQGREGGEP